MLFFFGGAIKGKKTAATTGTAMRTFGRTDGTESNGGTDGGKNDSPIQHASDEKKPMVDGDIGHIYTQLERRNGRRNEGICELSIRFHEKHPRIGFFFFPWPGWPRAISFGTEGRERKNK